MSKENQNSWPRMNSDDASGPTAFYATVNGYLKSNRSLSGPLRRGTTRGVGPEGLIAGSVVSDFGVDRITPIGFDPLGTSDVRAPSQEKSTLISRQTRK